MKHVKTVILAFIGLGAVHIAAAQDIPQSNVPAAVAAAFGKQFPKAMDIEWEMSTGLYKVEFELDRRIDHEVWFDEAGRIVKHQEEISLKELPGKVRDMIKRDFSGYTIDDLERITESNKVVYKVELNSLLQQDWEILADAAGNVLSKMAD